MTDTNTTKVLIPNKEWLIKSNDAKIGSISKTKRGYAVYRGGKIVNFHSLSEIKTKLNITVFDSTQYKKYHNAVTIDSIYGYPCSSRPYEPMYSIKDRIPVYIKSPKSKSCYCAGYYIINFKNNWIKSFCPKLITLRRYSYQGPFKTQDEANSAFNAVTETTE